MKARRRVQRPRTADDVPESRRRELMRKQLEGQRLSPSDVATIRLLDDAGKWPLYLPDDPRADE